MATITYSDKSYLNQNPNIPNVNKITDNDMNEIKTVVNTNYSEVGDISNLSTTDKTSVVNAINEIDTYGTYSATETDTGKKWTDGKTIYRRVLTATKVSGTNLDISASWATGIDTLVKLEGTMKATATNYSYPLQRYESSSMWSSVFMNRSAGTVSVSSSTGNYSNGLVNIIVEYTKV